jgi:uncharacterized repeat protein (TIGR04138 family)
VAPIATAGKDDGHDRWEDKYGRWFARAMSESTAETIWETVISKDTRYSRDAYFFVREALDFTQEHIKKENGGKPRHVSGQELLEGIRLFTLQQFGPMARTVLDEWGIRRCEDFGEIVFNMVEHKILSKTDKDSREDFKGGYDFRDAFEKPFIPSARLVQN